MSGRGWGKSRVGAEWLAWQAIRNPKTRSAIVAPTFADARDTCVEGESGILNVLRRYGAIGDDGYNKSTGRIRLLNGSLIKLFSGDAPERLRGPQHHFGWLDEFAAFKYPQEVWDNYQMGLRLGEKPQSLMTTTPRPRQIIKSLVARTDGTVTITRGSTFENAANLAASTLTELAARYEGTRTGRQELYGEILEDVEGALWTMANLDLNRVHNAPPLNKIVVAIDPAVTNNEGSDETGIVVAGKDNQGKAFVLADYSIKASPLEWAQRAIDAYDKHEANIIVGETNNGGDMIETILKQLRPEIPYKSVRASRGKQLRAEPVAAYYEQNRVSHLGGMQKLEDQMVSWTPDDPKSPDRVDALVWAITELLSTSGTLTYLAHLAVWCEKCLLPMPKAAQNCTKCGNLLTENLEPPHLLGV